MSSRDQIIETMARGILDGDMFALESQADEAAQAALQCLEAGGFVVVPREPTRAMVEAFRGTDFDEAWTGFIDAFEPDQGGKG